MARFTACKTWVIGTLLSSILLSAISTLSATASPSPQDLLASGNVDKVVEVLRQQIARAPNDAEAHNLLCRAYFMTEEWDLGIPECERARNLAPEKGLYYLWLGRIYGERADHVGFLSAAGLAKKVRNSFERAVELEPNSWEARTDLAEFYIEAPGIVGGGKDKALAEADRLVPLNPGMAHWVLARIAEKNKDPAQAEREYRAAISVTHGGARAWLDLAIFLRHSNRIEEMEQALRQLEIAPADHAESLMDGASLLLRAGHDYALGVRLIRRYFSIGTVEEGPAFKAHTYLGELLERQGDRRGAAAEYCAALDLYHNYDRAEDALKKLEH